MEDDQCGRGALSRPGTLMSGDERMRLIQVVIYLLTLPSSSLSPSYDNLHDYGNER